MGGEAGVGGVWASERGSTIGSDWMASRALAVLTFSDGDVDWRLFVGNGIRGEEGTVE